MSENKESVTGNYLGIAPGPDEAGSKEFFVEARAGVVGSFYYDYNFKHLCVKLPGTDYFTRWAIRPHKLRNGHSWEWDGNQEKPTLLPSLNYVGRWHGWLKAGEFNSC